jgi:hypothetical protein
MSGTLLVWLVMPGRGSASSGIGSCLAWHVRLSRAAALFEGVEDEVEAVLEGSAGANWC